MRYFALPGKRKLREGHTIPLEYGIVPKPAGASRSHDQAFQDPGKYADAIFPCICDCRFKIR